METKMYRVEALLGPKVVAVKSSWGRTSGEAINGIKIQFDHQGIKYDGLRAVVANNIYHASLKDVTEHNKNVVSERAGIPKVRTWVVKFWKGGKPFHTELVDTINKRFAYWMANEQSGYKSQKADKVTVTLKPEQPTSISNYESTKHEGLPNKTTKNIKESSMKSQKETIFKFINSICEKDYSSAKKELNTVIDEKIKARIKNISNSNKVGA